MLDIAFGLIAFVGFTIWVLSLITEFVVDIHRLVNRILGKKDAPVSVKMAVEDMFIDSTPYAATRNAKQAMNRRKP